MCHSKSGHILTSDTSRSHRQSYNDKENIPGKSKDLELPKSKNFPLKEGKDNDEPIVFKSIGQSSSNIIETEESMLQKKITQDPNYPCKQFIEIVNMTFKS